ncbi:MAG: hypothetical protein WA824_08170 [Candidatus Sulfotelmatobacter sp.]
MASLMMPGISRCASLAAQEKPAEENNGASTEQTLEILSSGKGASLIDKPIILTRLKVEEVPKSIDIAPKDLGQSHVSGFWIGSSAAERVFVSVPDGLVPVNTDNQTSQIRKQKVVTVTGTVRPAPDDTQLKAVYRLSAGGIEKIRQERIIVEAGSIVVH